MSSTTARVEIASALFATREAYNKAVLVHRQLRLIIARDDAQGDLSGPDREDVVNRCMDIAKVCYALEDMLKADKWGVK